MHTRPKRSVQCLLSLLIANSFCSSALAIDLNAPLNDRPTIATEIHRGMSAGFDCMIKEIGKSDDVLGCALRNATADEQRHPDYKPYELGLFLGACIWLEPSFGKGSARGHSVKPSGRFLSQFKLLYVLFRKHQDDLHITDEQIIAANPDLKPEGRKAVLASLEFWKNLPGLSEAIKSKKGH